MWDPKIGYRRTKIGEFEKIPCSGLHIKTLGEIKDFKIVKYEEEADIIIALFDSSSRADKEDKIYSHLLII